MTAERWAKVRALVEQAIDLPAEERREFLIGATSDLDLRAEAEQLLEYDKQSGRIFSIGEWKGKAETAATEANLIGVMIGSYRLLEELGRGGMGTVYLAERADGEYQQRVALKILQENIFTPALAERFRRERQILAQLLHPGVARLLDGGLTPDGRPFLVLEYVDGRPIDRYCDDKGLDTAARLQLFLRVAEVVQSAHQQLVLHLDLKPANILVTDEGEPRLLDFGIARFLTEAGTETHQTEATLRLLTPRYASPEQAEGAPLGVASDVFSLATLLYRLLTGSLPYPLDDASPLEAARIILSVAPVPPSEATTPAIRPLLRGDLDTILLQALRKEPVRRYPTIAAFADDIKRHLASKPVLAHADSFRYRAGKFLQRYRVAVSAAAVVILLFVVSGAAILHSASVARRQRALADKRFEDVRALAHSYIFDLDPQLEEVPGTMKVRAFILKNALKYLEAMSREDLQDDGLAREIGRGYMRVSQVQADFGMPSLNDRAGAWDSLNKSYAIQMRLLEKAPGDLAQRGLMLSQMRLMSALAITDGDVARAEQYTDRGLELGKPTLAAGAKAPRFLTLISLAWDRATHRCGNGDLWNTADPVEALRWADRMHELAEQYVAAHASDPADHNGADMLQREAMARAQIYRQIGRASEARALYDEALRMDEQGTQDIITVQSAKVTKAELASYLVEIHDVKGANALADGLLPKEFHENGVDRLLSSDEADTLTVLARIDLESGRVAEGKRKVELSMKTLDRLYREDPIDANTNSEYAHAAVDIADQPLLDSPTRERLYTRGIEVAEAYLHLHPEGLSAVLLAGRAEIGLAEIARAAHHTAEQETHALAAIDDLQKVLQAHPIQPQATLLFAQAKGLLNP